MVRNRAEVVESESIQVGKLHLYLPKRFNIPYDDSSNRKAFLSATEFVSSILDDEPSAVMAPNDVGFFTIYLLRGYIHHPFIDGPRKATYGLSKGGKCITFKQPGRLQNDWAGFEKGVTPTLQAAMVAVLRASTETPQATS